MFKYSEMARSAISCVVRAWVHLAGRDVGFHQVKCPSQPAVSDRGYSPGLPSFCFLG